MPSKCKSGGRKRHQNGKVTAKSAATQIGMKKGWWHKVPSKHESGGRKCPQNCKMVAKSATISVFVVVHYGPMSRFSTS